MIWTLVLLVMRIRALVQSHAAFCSKARTGGNIERHHHTYATKSSMTPPSIALKYGGSGHSIAILLCRAFTFNAGFLNLKNAGLDGNGGEGEWEGVRLSRGQRGERNKGEVNSVTYLGEAAN